LNDSLWSQAESLDIILVSRVYGVTVKFRLSDSMNKNCNILLIGDLMIDRYLWGRCDRISPEAPVPVIDIERESKTLGGAGNVVNNLLALGCKVTLFSVIGEDAAGSELKEMLHEKGIESAGILMQSGRRTSNKTRVIATHQQVVRFDSETKSSISQSNETALIEAVTKAMDQCDLILFSDYGKGILTVRTCQEIITVARQKGKKVLVDPKGRDYSKYKGAFLITPNRKEAGEATGLHLETLEDAKQAGAVLRRDLNLDYAIVTLSEEGMVVIHDEMHHIPTKARQVFDVTGAGDTVLAALGYSIATGKSVDEAAHFANLAAAVVVGKIGADTATLDEIADYEAGEGSK
jgi:D-beta-D-heptose 7-phosphate kinase / D-beta-D-heptose 1-phosphate adenosyltransferase